MVAILLMTEDFLPLVGYMVKLIYDPCANKQTKTYLVICNLFSLYGIDNQSPDKTLHPIWGIKGHYQHGWVKPLTDVTISRPH